MFVEPRHVLRTRAMPLEHKPDMLNQDSPSQKCSKNISWEPQKTIITFFGGAIDEPGRFATAWLH
eukprot:6984059-Pyramimonas_sp.AAC.1